MSSMRVGFSQLNASPRYPALPAAFMPAATDTAMKAQKPAPRKKPAAPAAPGSYHEVTDETLD